MAAVESARLSASVRSTDACPDERLADMRLAENDRYSHPAIRVPGRVWPWLVESRAGRSPVHLIEYRFFQTNISVFGKVETRRMAVSYSGGRDLCALGTSRFLLG